MELRTTSAETDGCPASLAWTNLEHDDTVTVQMWLGCDGVPVVQIDTPTGLGLVRINLNDGMLWEGDPETDSAQV